jgi:hypothetical protein
MKGRALLQWIAAELVWAADHVLCDREAGRDVEVDIRGSR